MSTRRLILLALACGVAILLAGGVKLLQVSGDQTKVPVRAMGEGAQVGDVQVTVWSIERTGDRVLVEVEVGGIEGLDAGAGWIMLADGERREPISAAVSNPATCPVTPDRRPVRCTVVFPFAERVQAVAFARAGEQRQWAAPQR